MELMEITNDARDMLTQVFQDKSATGIRVYFAGFGWGQPKVGLALDEPEAEDKVITINEIQVAIDPNIESYTEALVLDLDKQMNGLVLRGNDSDCC